MFDRTINNIVQVCLTSLSTFRLSGENPTALLASELASFLESVLASPLCS